MAHDRQSFVIFAYFAFICGRIAVSGMTDPARITCFFSTSGHSGVDRLAQNLIPALARRGYRVDLLKVRRHGPELREVPEGVEVRDLGSRHTYACLPAIVRYLRRERPAVMLSDKDRVNRVALAARVLARVPTRLVLRSGTTVSVDLASRGPLERWVQRRSMGWLYRFADTVVVNSRAAADDLSAYTGLPRHRIRVVPNPAVPEARFAETLPRPAHPWFAPGEPPVILGVGELGARKDFGTLIRAFAIVRRRRACRLLILGRGRARDELQRLASSLGVAADVELPGFRADPQNYMAHAAIFAFTSLWEGNPVVLPEALAVGTPVVATDCPSGPREVLDGGRYGPLVPVGDPIAFAAAIVRTLDNPLPAETLREAARPFAVEASTDAYLDVMGLPHRPPAQTSETPPGMHTTDPEPPATAAGVAGEESGD
jgi:glycosyltransferase involved in cell wall biosynthesis